MTNLERIRAMDFETLCYFLFGDCTPCPICPCYLCELDCDEECIDHFEAFVFDNIPKRYKDKEWRLAAAIFLAESTALEFSAFLQSFFDCACCARFEGRVEDLAFCSYSKECSEENCHKRIADWLSAEFDESDWIQRFPDPIKRR